MEVVELENLSVEVLRRAHTVSATDGLISLALWTNPFDTGTEIVLVPVAKLTHSAIEPVRLRVLELLGIKRPGALEMLQPED